MAGQALLLVGPGDGSGSGLRFSFPLCTNGAQAMAGQDRESHDIMQTAEPMSLSLDVHRWNTDKRLLYLSICVIFFKYYFIKPYL